MEPIDEQTLVAIAELICADGKQYYRGVKALLDFFRRASWDVGEYDGESRKAWTIAQLLRRRDDGAAIEQVLKRMADPREYRQDRASADEVLDHLNHLLEVENLHIELDVNLHPVVRTGRATPPDLPVDISRQKLQYSISEIVTDRRLVAVLEQRVVEVEKCRASGCHLAAMVLLGSLLEGLLLDAAENRPIPKSIWEEPEAKAENIRPASRADKLSLQALIYVAHRLKWIDTDAYRIASAVRDFRNLVHPNAQRKLERSPDEDTVDMYWPVFVGTANDLGRTRPDGPGEGRPAPSADTPGPWGSRSRSS